ncbi:MAG: hypothetical protein HY702_01525 [Gemmatimonadetes bacterium]|nr:hypothetical protein [Gemmatimonadota bacterium]
MKTARVILQRGGAPGNGSQPDGEVRRLLEVADLAREYDFTDVDGRQVPPFREFFPEVFRD